VFALCEYLTFKSIYLTASWQSLISGPCRGTRVRFLSLNRIQSRVVTGLLTGHNTLRRHLHLMGLMDSPLCRSMEQRMKPVPTFCQCEALASLRQAHLGSFFLEPEDINSQSLGAIWCFSKAAGLPWVKFGAQRAGFFKG
jgi:hypothetical protein